MLFCEFIEGTGCRENDYNFKVYKNLEIIYMNSDISKQEIYEMGKKLVNNEKPAYIVEIENEWKSMIAQYRKDIEWYKKEISQYTELMRYSKETCDYEYAKTCKRYIQLYRDNITETKRKISELKWCLSGE